MMTADQKSCEHEFRGQSLCGNIAKFKCELCDTCVEYKLEKDEVKEVQRFMDEGSANIAEMHSTWHDFTKRFMNGRGSFIWRGYELMKRVRKWVEQNTFDAKIIKLDDDMHMGSIMLLIDHRLQWEYWGTTVVMIPQNSAQEPCVMFMYPHSVDALVDVLQAIHDEIEINEQHPTKPDDVWDYLNNEIAPHIAPDDSEEGGNAEKA